MLWFAKNRLILQVQMISLGEIPLKGEVGAASFSSCASITDALVQFLWENRLSLVARGWGGKDRRQERASFLVSIWQFFHSSFIRRRSAVRALPALSQAREADPQCPYTSTVPRRGCSSTLPTPNCPALPKQTDVQPSITSAGSDTEEALPASVDPHSQARLKRTLSEYYITKKELNISCLALL